MVPLDKKDKYARMQQKIELKPDTSYTLSFDGYVGEDFVGQMGCSVYRTLDGKSISAGSAGVKRSSAASAPKRYPEKQPPVPTQWQTMVPNGMLEYLNDTVSGPWGWSNETKHAKATWPLRGVDGDHRLVIDTAHGGSGKWISAPFHLDANKEYVIAWLHRYGHENSADAAKIQVITTETNKEVFTRPLSIFGSWQRGRGRFVAKQSGDVNVLLHGHRGMEVPYDQIMIMPANVCNTSTVANRCCCHCNGPPATDMVA